MPVTDPCPKCRDKRAAALKLARAILGLGGAPPAVQQERMARCKGGCPHYVGSRLGWLADRCDLCGCLVHAKVKVAEERCPDSPPRWREAGWDAK